MSKTQKTSKRVKPRRKARRQQAHRAASQIAYKRVKKSKDLLYTISADCQPELW